MPNDAITHWPSRQLDRSHASIGGVLTWLSCYGLLYTGEWTRER
jgi:hypothetical protein